MSETVTAGAIVGRLTAEMLVDQPKLDVDRLPVLHNVFERLGAFCSEGLRQLCGAPTTFFVNQVDNGSSWDVLESYEDSIAAVLYSPEWESRIIIGLDRRFVFSIMEAFFGGDGKEPAYEGERPFSALESRISKAVCEIAATSLQSAFAIVLDATFKLERVETRIEFSLLGQRNVPVIVGQMLFQVLDHGGRMYVLIPQSALHPLKDNLMRERPMESMAVDPRWSRRMQSGIASTEVVIQATMEGRMLNLKEISNLRVGEIMPLRPSPTAVVTLECGDERLFKCSLGQAQGNFTIVVESRIDQRDEFIGDILGTNQRQ